jgi:mono/diheme cytochrome c family protein
MQTNSFTSKMHGRKIFSSIMVLAASVTILSFTLPRQSTEKDPWPVPDKYLKMKNPVKADKESLEEGKQIWTKHCQSCHGKKGKGDGPKAAQLKTTPDDMTKPDVQKQPDGAFFYKTLQGRKDMPSFKKKISDQDDIWSVVNYLRTFKK